MDVGIGIVVAFHISSIISSCLVLVLVLPSASTTTGLVLVRDGFIISIDGDDNNICAVKFVLLPSSLLMENAAVVVPSLSLSPFSPEDSISNDDDGENDVDRSTTISAVVVVEVVETLLLLLAVAVAGRTITSSDSNCIDSMAAPTNAVPTRMYIRLAVIARLLLTMLLVLLTPPPLPPLAGKIGFMLPAVEELLETLFLGLSVICWTTIIIISSHRRPRDIIIFRGASLQYEELLGPSLLPASSTISRESEIRYSDSEGIVLLNQYY